MDVSTWVLFGLVVLIGANHLLVRIPRVRRDPRLFWAINVADIAVGLAVLAFGLPGYASTPVIGWVVGLLLVMHVAQNLQLRSSWEQAERAEAQAARERERKRMRQDREAREE